MDWGNYFYILIFVKGPNFLWIRIWKDSVFRIIKNYNLVNYLFLGLHKASKSYKRKPSAFKREHPALQNIKFLVSFSFLPSWIRIRIHWPDWIRIQSGSETLEEFCKDLEKNTILLFSLEISDHFGPLSWFGQMIHWDHPRQVDMGSYSCQVKNFCVIYLVDITEVPDFNKMYELYDPCTIMFFFRNKHIMIDLGTGNNNKINWPMEDKQVREGFMLYI